MIRKRTYRKWHRYAGAITAFFLVFLTTTGILLNHTSALQLQNIVIKNPGLLDWYGIKPPTITSLNIEQQWISSDGESLYFNTTPISTCHTLITSIVHQDLIVSACDDKLIFTTASGELVEEIDSSSGLPSPIAALFSNESKLYLTSSVSVYQMNVDELTFIEQSSELTAPTVLFKETPPAIHEAIIKQSSAYGINLERVLLDIHSGRIAGTLGILLIDATGLLLLFLAASGLTLWLKKSH